MARSRKEVTPKKSRKPAMTPEARENQMISLAVDLAEKQLINGTASAQVITHYLKLATEKSSLENEKLRRENEFLQAKSENLKSQQRVEELYTEAMAAMRSYSGLAYGDENDDD